MSSTLPRILRTKDVLSMLSISKPTLWAWRRAGRFPQPLRLGPNTVGWPEPVVAKWLASRGKSA